MIQRDLNPPDEKKLAYSELVDSFFYAIKFTYEDKIIDEIKSIINEAERHYNGFDMETYCIAAENCFYAHKQSPVWWLIKNEKVDLRDIEDYFKRFTDIDFGKFMIWLTEDLIFEKTNE